MATIFSIYRKHFELLDEKDTILIRPANYPESKLTPGKGYHIINSKLGKLGVINLQGRVFMKEGTDNPFTVVDELLKRQELQNIPIFVDFHTEATSEIMAMGWYLDGRVSAIVGTHTHVPTADARILPKGTAFISDVGMVGPRDSVIGIERKIIIDKFLTGLPIKHEVASGPAVVNAVFINLNEKENVIERINMRTDV